MGTFSRSLRQYYTARLLSQANIFCLIVYYMIFAVPFYLSFTTDYFWLKATTEFLPVSYQFTGNYLTNIQFTNGTNVSSYTSSNIGALQLSSVSASSPNVVLSGLSSDVSHSFTVVVTSPAGISSLELLLMFQITIPALNAKYITTSTVSVDVLSTWSAINIVGLLDYQNNSPLSAIANDDTQTNLPPYLQQLTYTETYSDIKNNAYNSGYLLRTTLLSSDFQNSAATPATQVSINIQLISKPMASITYYPGFLQTLKMAFSQYISLWLIAFALGNGLLIIIAKNNVFPFEKQENELSYIKRQQY